MGISFRPGHRLVDPFRQRQRIIIFHPAIISIGPDGFIQGIGHSIRLDVKRIASSGVISLDGVIQGIGCPIRLDAKAEYMLPPPPPGEK